MSGNEGEGGTELRCPGGVHARRWLYTPAWAHVEFNPEGMWVRVGGGQECPEQVAQASPMS